jgi:hypothetical protein
VARLIRHLSMTCEAFVTERDHWRAKPRMGVMYKDRWIECASDDIRIRGYYFPWGTKRIPYRSIRAVRRVGLSAMRGKGRIWGTANPRYWASLDPGRPRKNQALVLDVGRFVRPFITPDDPEAVESAIRQHAHLEHAGRGGPAPIVLPAGRSVCAGRMAGSGDQPDPGALQALGANKAMLTVFAEVGLPVQRHYADGVFELTFPLPRDDDGTALDGAVPAAGPVPAPVALRRRAPPGVPARGLDNSLGTGAGDRDTQPGPFGTEGFS